MERIRLDIIPKGLMPVCHASQYDAGRVIRLDLMDGLQGYSLTNEEIELNVRKPDGHIVTASVDVVEGQTYVDIVTTEQMCAVEGENICELKISKDNAEIYSLNFRMMVEKSVTEGGDTSESFIYNLRTQIAEGVAEEVATQYDSSNVIFDEEPTENHGIGYTVTSEGIKTAIDNAFDYDNTASGSLVHITDGADNIPVKSIVSEIVAVESGSGEKSPTNPYTISGFDSGVITRCGKNLFNSALEQGTINSSTGGINPSTTRCVNTDLIPIPQGDNRLSSNKKIYEVAYFDKAKNFITTGYFNTNIAVLNTSYAYFRISIRNEDNSTILPSDIEIQLELGNTATTYEAYNGNTYEFAFGRTVCGGHFDNKGNLVVTHGFVEITGTENLYLDTAPNVVALSGIPIPISQVDTSLLEPMSNYATYSTQGTGNFNNNEYGLRTSGIVYYKNTSCTTLNDFKTFFGNNHLQICYKLANPITLAITSQDIPTILGENNIFSNTGDVEVDYYTSKSNDILEFIDSEIGKKNGTNIPIEANSQDSIKDYIDNEVSNINLDDLSDTDISGETSGQILAFDGANWVNTNQIGVKYEEIDVTFDASGEGTLFNSVKFVVGLKDIPSDQLYVGYVSYIAGSTIKIKALSRTAIAFSSQNNVSSTRKVGVYYLDNITTQ